MSGGLYLIDGSNLAFRVFHAMPRLTAEGHHTGALLGFANILRRLQREESPDYAAVAFDRGPSFRTDLYPDYKGHRPDMPEELREQWPLLEPLVEAWGFRYLVREGFEADDIICTLARRHASEDCPVTIVSGDKDFAQLVDGNITLLDYKKSTPRRTGASDVEERFGVPPDRIVDLLALWGDSSDNVPGVPGIGKVKGARLLKRFGSLEEVLAHADEIKGKMGQNIRSHADQAKLSRTLATLRDDADPGGSLQDLAVRERDTAALRAFFRKYQLKSHLEELERTDGASEGFIDRDIYRRVRTVEELEQVVRTCRERGRFAVDTETTSLDPLEAQIVGISLCWSESDAVYVPLRHREGGNLPVERALRVLGPLLADSAVGKVGQNLKYDLEVLLEQGMELNGIVGDTLLADYLLESSRQGRSLDDLALRYLGHTMIAYADLFEEEPEGADFTHVPVERATRYAAEDAHVAWLLHEKLHPRLEAASLLSLYDEVEVPLVPCLADMERNGIRVDPDALAALGEELERRIDVKRAEIHEMAGHPFNINSTRQLAKVLFDERGLEPVRRTRTGRSTDARTLEVLSSQDPIPTAVLEYRSLSKLANTYVEAFPRWVNERTGRVHSSFHQAVAATGRLSSNEPNLQNIPIRTAEGRRIRACFVPEEGHLFLSADYSQVELRILADYCGEGKLLEAFLEGRDIHRHTASVVFDVSPELVSGEQRRAAKAINFGIIYGMGAYRLSNELGISRRRAQGIIEDYFERYPQVHAYLEHAISSAREKGYAETRFGRRRVIPDLQARVRHVREAAERIAVNTPIQGTAADIVKIAMIRVRNRLREEYPAARMLVQVHDELLLEVPEDQVDPVGAAVAEEMENAVELRVPLVVDLGRGRNWEQAH